MGQKRRDRRTDRKKLLQVWDVNIQKKEPSKRDGTGNSGEKRKSGSGWHRKKVAKIVE